MKAPLRVFAKSRPVAKPSSGRATSDIANRVTFNLRGATPRWHGSVGHDAPQNPVRVVASPGRRFRVPGGRGAGLASARRPLRIPTQLLHQLRPSRVRVSAMEYQGHLSEAFEDQPGRWYAYF